MSPTVYCIVVYVLDEIAELANGGGEVAQGLADATVKRLGNKSPVVKQKVQACNAVRNDAWHGVLRGIAICRFSDLLSM